MIDSHYLLGYPKKEEKGLYTIYPPKVKDVMENEKFFLYKSLLTTSQEDIEDLLREKNLPLDNMPTPLEYLLQLSMNKEIQEDIQNAFKIFIHEEVFFLPKEQIIILGNIKDTLSSISNVNELRILNEDNFFDFQNNIRMAMGEQAKKPMDLTENMKIRDFKAKSRYRDKIAAKQKGGLSFGGSLVSICCMNVGINLLNIGELSYAATQILIRYYQEKQKYEIDIQSLLAGADSKKVQPKNWIRDIED